MIDIPEEPLTDRKYESLKTTRQVRTTKNKNPLTSSQKLTMLPKTDDN